MQVFSIREKNFCIGDKSEKGLNGKNVNHTIFQGIVLNFLKLKLNFSHFCLTHIAHKKAHEYYKEDVQSKNAKTNT